MSFLIFGASARHGWWMDGGTDGSKFGFGGQATDHCCSPHINNLGLVFPVDNSAPKRLWPETDQETKAKMGKMAEMQRKLLEVSA